MSDDEIKAVEMVREIRDHLSEQLQGKTREEIKEFFRLEAAAANAEAARAFERSPSILEHA